MVGERKEVLRIAEGRHWLFDLASDPRESRSTLSARISQHLNHWLDTVQQGLIASDRLGPAEVDPEHAERLRALGYVH
jgi:hypothetical protein